MSIAEKLRQLDQVQGYDTAGRVRTVQITGLPPYVRDLHELHLDDEYDHYEATDKGAAVVFFIEGQYPQNPNLANVESVMLVYRRD